MTCSLWSALTFRLVQGRGVRARNVARTRRRRGAAIPMQKGLPAGALDAAPAIAANMPVKAPSAPHVDASWGGFHIGDHVGSPWFKCERLSEQPIMYTWLFYR